MFLLELLEVLVQFLVPRVKHAHLEAERTACYNEVGNRNDSCNGRHRDFDSAGGVGQCAKIERARDSVCRLRYVLLSVCVLRSPISRRQGKDVPKTLEKTLVSLSLRVGLFAIRYQGDPVDEQHADHRTSNFNSFMYVPSPVGDETIEQLCIAENKQEGLTVDKCLIISC